MKRPAGTHSYGGSLYLVVRGSGRASWVFRQRRGGKLHSHGLGSYPTVSLADARVARDKLRTTTGASSTSQKTFAVAAENFLVHHASDYSHEQLTRLRALVRLHCGALHGARVSSISVEVIADVLRPIWNGTVNSRGAKLRSLIERVIDSADLDRNPATWRRLKSHLPGRRAAVAPVRSLPWARVPDAYAELALDEVGIAATALRFLILTGLRLKEGCGVLWSEIDYPKRTLTVPASRMKVKTTGDFVVPLSREAIGLLRSLEHVGNFVFPGRLGSFIGPHAMHNAVGRLELGITIHGFRASLATFGQDHGFMPAVVDAALAHFAGGVSGAYQRSRLLPERRKLLDRWARHCCAATL
jgi:integrase